MFVKIDNVSKTYKQSGEILQALQNVNLEIEKSEFISLIGPSGCGKTTLLNILAGFESVFDGHVHIGGKEVTKSHSPGVTIFQNYGLLPWRTIRKNVELGLEAKKTFSQREIHSISDEYLELVGLTSFAKHYPHQLSGGMRQRAAIASALAVNPEIIFMDEPLGALDAFARMQIQDEILRIWQKHKTTVVFITHDIDEAIYLSDRIVVMSPRPGKIQEIINIYINRPRQRNLPEFLDLRAKILEILHFAKKLQQPDFYL
ncbi:MAG: ABC transporter ATP-binding protein [Fibromonadaceae bacterium]|jgi:NitT/TauT family transport system ATP-binding protein|nr:ABC transporter ATP-binding protein [Fibromonadaceae bacterium]